MSLPERRSVLIGLGIAAVLLIGGLAAVTDSPITGFLSADQDANVDMVREKVKSIYQVRGADVTIEAVTPASEHLYKVIVSSGSNMQELYVTKDGKHLVQNPVNIQDFITRVEQRKQFLDCLRNNSVQIVGRTDLNATRMQLQLLGGAQGMNGIYVEASNQTIRTLLRNNVTHLPVTVHNGQFYEGVKRPSFYEQLVGCQYPQ
ncbi:MAG: hypothetical protein SVU32_02665 [Candidatus Nanohaloarchaea archaeon]|nr:hypothetical protein [Candidatus Nanohaloarchaea archaeon]